MLHSLLAFVLGLLVPTAHAQDVWHKYYAPFGGSGSGRMFIIAQSTRLANFFLIIVSSGAVIAIIYGGIGMIRSGGNDEGKENAKKIVQFAVAGLLLAIMAQALLAFLARFVQSFTPTVIP